MYKIGLVCILFVIISCSEITSHSGKLIDNNINYKQIKDKQQLLSTLGVPTYIDPIEKKFYYYSEDQVFKNFYNNGTLKRDIYVFEFDESGRIVFFKKYDLDNFKKIDLSNNTTENNMIERGWIEKIFGGIGKGQIPNAN